MCDVGILALLALCRNVRGIPAVLETAYKLNPVALSNIVKPKKALQRLCSVPGAMPHGSRCNNHERNSP